MKRIVAGALLVAATSLVSASNASAAPKPNDEKVRTANPAQACAVVTTYMGGSFNECVQGLATGSDPLYQAALTIGCVELEAGTPDLPAITWPYTFYENEEMPPGWPLLRAHNRDQCAMALFTFHSIAPIFFPEP